MSQAPLDTYRVHAQLAPALIVLLPVVVGVIAWFPGAVDLGRVLIGAAITTGGMFFLAQVGRDAGKRKEAWLHSTWGGKPTTALLRHRDDTLDVSTRSRYHGFLSVCAQGATWPSPEVEGADPEAADSMYDSAVQWLIAQASDRRRFPLVFQENVNYGFRRNLWGLRPMGLAIAVGCLIANVTAAFAMYSSGNHVPVEGLIGLLVTGLLVVPWLVIVKPDWVRVPAFAYARALFQVCDVISADTSCVGGREAMCRGRTRILKRSGELQRPQRALCRHS